MTSARQATKSSKKNQARDAINALCQILNGSGYISRITPERFRQAKFDQPEALEPLWMLLTEVVVHKFPAFKDRLAASPNRDTIKSILYHHGYQCKKFVDSSETSSREVLLALGWVCAKFDIVNKEVERQLNSSSPQVIPSHPSSDEHDCNDMSNEKETLLTTKQLNKGQAPTASSPTAQVRYLVWMMGRLRLTLKALYSEQQAMCIAMHHIHRTTQSVSAPPHRLGHLTAWDAYLLRHPKQLKKYIEHLEKEANILQACISWRDLEPVFWQWMISVQEAKLVEVAQDCDDTHPETHHSNHPRHLMMSSEEFPGALELSDHEASLSKQLDHLEAVLSSACVHEVLKQVPDRPDVAKKKTDIDNTIKARLAVDFEQLGKSGPRSFPLRTVQFHYKQEERTKGKQKSECLPENFVDIRSEILRLTSQVRTLEEELEELRKEQQQKLDSFAESLTGVVCIPPMSEKATFSG